MKKLIYLLLAVLTISCSTPDIDKSTLYIGLSKQSVTADFESNRYTVGVTANCSWVASTADEWIVLETERSTPDSEELSFTVAYNESSNSRKGLIVVKNAEYDIVTELSVSQKGFTPTLTITPESLIFTSDGGTQNIDVEANFEYEVNIAAEWLSFEKSERTLSVVAKANAESLERAAEIVISSEKYSISQIVRVTQAAKEVVELFDRDTIITNYVEYRTGNVPIIFSAPHGSTVDGGSIDGVKLIKRTKDNMDETDPSFSTTLDTRTLSLSRLIDSVFYAKTGKHPYTVFAKVSRKYVDLNRKRARGVPKNGTANGVVWDTYHATIAAAREEMTSKYGEGLLLDIHGHGHSIKRIEIGYMLTKEELDLTDTQLISDEKYVLKSSICGLVNRNKNGYNFAELLRGTYSLGYYFSRYDLSSVPSPSAKSPGSSNPYFNGGYITSTYDSSNDTAGTFDAIQLEFDSKTRESKNLQKTAESVVSAVLDYFDKHYNTAIPKNE